MIRKQPNSSDDYQAAHQLINSSKPGTSKTIDIDNIKAFRKYLCDLGSRKGHKYTTRQQNGSLFVMRIL